MGDIFQTIGEFGGGIAEGFAQGGESLLDPIEQGLQNLRGPEDRTREVQTTFRILAGGSIPSNDALIADNGFITTEELDKIYPEYGRLSSDRQDIVLSYPENFFQEDVNHMILFEMYEREPEDARYVRRTVNQIGSVEKLAEEFYNAENRDQGNFSVGGFWRGASRELNPTKSKKIMDLVREQLAGTTTDVLSTDAFIDDFFEDSLSNTGRTRTDGFGREFKSKTLMKTPAYKSKQSIFLYMPSAINDVNLLTYDTPELLFANFLTELVQGVFGAGNAREAGLNLAKGIVSNADLAINVASGFVDQLGNMIDLPINSKSAFSNLRGMAQNPRKEQLFTGQEFRTFTYTFEFYPKSERETEMVNSIVRMFKYHAYPALNDTGNWFEFPATFRIKYLYKDQFGAVKENIYLNRIKDCVLTEVNADYTASGKFVTFKNGAPVGVKLSLTFKEVEVVTKDDILEGA